MASLEFTVDSALLSELGEKLVETAHIALVELVKNAYDADATKVVVKLLPAPSGGPTVIVEDNGVGMTLDQVKAYWMRIATTNKTQQRNSSVFGRPRTGSKGIGRFSCRRLGDRLAIRTIGQLPSGRFQETEIQFDWKHFKPGTDITLVKCPGRSETTKVGSTGTQLTMTGATRDEWSKRGYDYLRRHLTVLAANRGTKRRGFATDPGFEIGLECPGFSGEVIDIREQIMLGGWGIIDGSVERDGTACLNLNAKDLGSRKASYPKRIPLLHGVSFRIGIIPSRKEQLRDPAALSNQTVARILPDWGGVQIRHNGFRVYPYGDDDWLGIDFDRARRLTSVDTPLKKLASRLTGTDPSRVLLSLLSMRNYIGAVEIGPNATGFELKASREGFIETEAFGELKALVRYAIDWSTVYRDFYIRQQHHENVETAKERLEHLTGRTIDSEHLVESAANLITETFRNVSDSLPARERTRAIKTFKSATDAIAKWEESIRTELHQLRLIASGSTLLLIFSHEVRTLLGLLAPLEGQLTELSTQIHGPTRKRLDRASTRLADSRQRLAELLAMTALMSDQSLKTRAAKLALRERVEKAIEWLRLITSRYKITIDASSIPNNITVGPIVEAELYAVLLNAISNSIKSVVASANAKEIAVSANKSANGTIILFKDKGIGIDERHFEDVFLPFVTDPSGRMYRRLASHLNPEDRAILGSGSGLGLSILKYIVEHRKGSVRFVTPEKGWSSTLQVELP